MRAIGITAYGGSEVLEWQDIPTPIPGPDEVLIKVRAAGINFMDVHTRQGKYETSTTYPVRLPVTLGVEGSGDIVEVGERVGFLAPGDRVAWCLSWGSYAQYAAVPARLVAKIPDAVDYSLAAAAMFPGCTAHYLANDVGRLGEGMTCLIHGASGVIGQILVQLCGSAGATVYAATSSTEKAEAVRGLGAHRVLLYSDGNIGHTVRAETGGGVDVVFDAVGRTTLRDSFRATRKRGLVVNYGAVAGPVTDLDPLELGESGSLFLTRPRLADHMQNRDTVQARADGIFRAALDGTLTVPISGHYAFEDVSAAHAALEGRTSFGKAILDIPV